MVENEHEGSIRRPDNAAPPATSGTWQLRGGLAAHGVSRRKSHVPVFQILTNSFLSIFVIR